MDDCVKLGFQRAYQQIVVLRWHLSLHAVDVRSISYVWSLHYDFTTFSSKLSFLLTYRVMKHRTGLLRVVDIIVEMMMSANKSAM